MPTIIKGLLDHFKISEFGKIRWGEMFNDDNEGVYIVSTSHEEDKNQGIRKLPVFNDIVLEQWIIKCPSLTIDNDLPTLQSLKKRLFEFWLPDENILYIGKAEKRSSGKGLSNRIKEFYN